MAGNETGVYLALKGFCVSCSRALAHRYGVANEGIKADNLILQMFSYIVYDMPYFCKTFLLITVKLIL